MIPSQKIIMMQKIRDSIFGITLQYFINNPQKMPHRLYEIETQLRNSI